jgi:hypothetical protein
MGEKTKQVSGTALHQQGCFIQGEVEVVSSDGATSKNSLDCTNGNPQQSAVSTRKSRAGRKPRPFKLIVANPDCESSEEAEMAFVELILAIKNREQRAWYRELRALLDESRERVPRLAIEPDPIEIKRQELQKQKEEIEKQLAELEVA